MLGDAYLHQAGGDGTSSAAASAASSYGGGSATRTLGLESPTYTQLENAAMSTFNKPLISSSLHGGNNVYNNYNSLYTLKSDGDANIYSVRGHANRCVLDKSMGDTMRI